MVAQGIEILRGIRHETNDTKREYLEVLGLTAEEIAEATSSYDLEMVDGFADTGVVPGHAVTGLDSKAAHRDDGPKKDAVSSPGAFRIRSLLSGFCLSIENTKGDSGEEVHCVRLTLMEEGSLEQLWQLSPTGHLESLVFGSILVSQGKRARVGDLSLAAKVEGDALQTWKSTSDGVVENLGCNLLLTIRNGSKSVDAAVWLNSSKKSKSQSWSRELAAEAEVEAARALNRMSPAERAELQLVAREAKIQRGVTSMAATARPTKESKQGSDVNGIGGFLSRTRLRLEAMRIRSAIARKQRAMGPFVFDSMMKGENSSAEVRKNNLNRSIFVIILHLNRKCSQLIGRVSLSFNVSLRKRKQNSRSCMFPGRARTQWLRNFRKLKQQEWEVKKKRLIQ